MTKDDPDRLHRHTSEGIVTPQGTTDPRANVQVLRDPAKAENVVVQWDEPQRPDRPDSAHLIVVGAYFDFARNAQLADEIAGFLSGPQGTTDRCPTCGSDGPRVQMNPYCTDTWHTRGTTDREPPCAVCGHAAHEDVTCPSCPAYAKCPYYSPVKP